MQAETPSFWSQLFSASKSSSSSILVSSSTVPTLPESASTTSKNFTSATLSSASNSFDNGAVETLILPKEASKLGGDPILVLLSEKYHITNDKASAAELHHQFVFVYEGSNRRHVASCEFSGATGLVSRIPEHDISETVDLLVLRDGQVIEKAKFTYYQDFSVDVAQSIADSFPAIPDMLTSLLNKTFLSDMDNGHTNFDKRLFTSLCEATFSIDQQGVVPPGYSCKSSDQVLVYDSVFHHCAAQGWLLSLAYLLSRSKRAELWLKKVHNSSGKLILDLVEERRFRSIFSNSDSFSNWIYRLVQQVKQEQAVVNVDTRFAPQIVIMTTNKQKAELSLDEDLSIFMDIERENKHDRFLLNEHLSDSNNIQQLDNRKTTISTCTEIGKSIEDISAGSMVESSAQFANGDIYDYLSCGAISKDGKTALPGSPFCPEENFPVSHEDDSTSVGDSFSQHATVNSQLAYNRSISTPTLYGDVKRKLSCPNVPSNSLLTVAHELSDLDEDLDSVRFDSAGDTDSVCSNTLSMTTEYGYHRSHSTNSFHCDEIKKKKSRKGSILSKLGSSYRQKHKHKQQQMLQVPGEHEWHSGSSSSKCTVCHLSNKSPILKCNLCHLKVHCIESCRQQVVPCLSSSSTFANNSLSPTADCASYSSMATNPTFTSSVDFWKREEAKAVASLTRPVSASNVGNNSVQNSVINENEEIPQTINFPRHTRASSVCNDRRPSVPCLDSMDGNNSPVSVVNVKLEQLTQELNNRSASWADNQEKKVLKKVNEKLVRRCNFIYELISTEISHLKNLVVLRVVFRDVLCKMFDGDKVLDRATVESLFPHLDKMEQLHSKFLEDLRKCDPKLDASSRSVVATPLTVGAVIQKHLSDPQWLNVYGSFCSQHKISLQRKLNNLTVKLQHFSVALKDCERSPQAGRKTLQDYYLLLTQRLSKYKSVFPQIKELARIPPEDTHISAACDTLETLMSAVNSKIEEFENEHNLNNVIAGFQPLSSNLTVEYLKQRQGRCVHCGSLKWIQQQDKTVINCFALLLNDSLVFLTESNLRKYSPVTGIQSPSVISFPTCRAIVREDDSVKSKVGFFIIVHNPEALLFNLSCHSFEERTKWIHKINQVITANPTTDLKLQEEEERLKNQMKAAGSLLSDMESKDKEILCRMNEKNQLWQQLLSVWNYSLDESSMLGEHNCKSSVNDSVEDISISSSVTSAASPEEICSSALCEINRLRQILHSNKNGIINLTRSASNAEDKSEASGVNLPKRAETFGGYDVRTNAESSELEEASTGKVLIQEMTPSSDNNNSRNLPPSNNKIKSGFYASMRKQEKTRRSSVFGIFRKPKDRNSVGEESGSEPELRAPEATSLVALDRLHLLVESLSKVVISQQTIIAKLSSREQEQRRRVEMLSEKKDDSPRQQHHGTLEQIRNQRSEFEKERSKWKDEQEREKARLESRKEQLEHREEDMKAKEEQQKANLEALQREHEEQLRLREEKLRNDEQKLLENRKILQLQADMLGEQEVPQLQIPLVKHTKSHSSERTTATSSGMKVQKQQLHTLHVAGNNGNNLVASKSQSKSASNLMVQQSESPTSSVHLPTHLASKVNQERYSSTTNLEVATPLPLHLASDNRKHKSKVPLIEKLQKKSTS